MTMQESGLIRKYFTALCNQDGAMMRGLFSVDGVIDDYVGRHHLGGDAIEAFINQVARRKLKIVSGFVQEGARWTVIAEIAYDDGRITLVRWIFQVRDGKIIHVGNTAVQHCPAQWLQPEPELMQSA